MKQGNQLFSIYTISTSVKIPNQFFLGIYLISDNEYTQKLIWHQLFNMRQALTYPWWLMIVYILGVTIVVFVCCGILEYIRQLIFSKFERWAYVKGNKFQEKIGLEF